MSKLSLKQAAEFAGTTKPTILKHMAKSRVSGQKDEHGQWWFDIAELVRAYGEPGSRNGSGNTPVNGRNPLNLQGEAPLETLEMAAELAAVRARLAVLTEERERERRDKEATIADLRTRLNASEEERRKKDNQLTALLTDQSRKAATEDTKPKGWLARLMGA